MSEIFKFNYFFKFIKAVVNIFFITGLSLFLLFFQSLILEAADESVETVIVKSPAAFYAPLYPKNYSSADSIITVSPGSEFKVLKELSVGYIVEGPDGECFAPGNFFLYERLVKKNQNYLKSKNFNAADFFKIKLPAEIENSEFFFNNASKKSFYTLAFLLYLKNGPDYSAYEQALKDYDDFMAAASKKGLNLSVIEAFTEFFNSGAGNKGGVAVCVKRRLTEKTAYALLSEHKPAVFLTYLNAADGEIVAAYSMEGREGFEKEVNCYIYGRGVQAFKFKEFEALLHNSSNLFMVLM